METLFASFGRATVRFRWLIVIGWIVIAVASMRTLPSLGSEINNNNSHFLPSSAPSIQAFNLATPLLGNNSNDECRRPRSVEHQRDDHCG